MLIAGIDLDVVPMQTGVAIVTHQLWIEDSATSGRLIAVLDGKPREIEGEAKLTAKL